jgi:hypothetical protein
MAPASAQPGGVAPFQFNRYTVVLRRCTGCPHVDSVTLAGNWTLAQLLESSPARIERVWVVTEQDKPVAVLTEDAYDGWIPSYDPSHVGRMVHGPLTVNTLPAEATP